MTLLGINPAAFARPGVDQGPVGVDHELRSHRLLTLDALADLADRLPLSSVEHHRGDLPPVLPGGKPPKVDGLRPGEMVRGIETNGCWMVLWNIEQDPDYAALLDECVREVQPLATPRERVPFREGFIFISAPNSVTPVHIDAEHNVLLQITGEKTMTVGRFADQQLEEREIERIIAGGDRNVPVAAVDEQPFLLRPGKGVYVPPFAPHWVRNGPTPCISLSVTWRTERYFRREQAYWVNAHLRRLGLTPRPPDVSPVADRAKSVAFHTLRAAWRVKHRLRPRPAAARP